MAFTHLEQAAANLTLAREFGASRIEHRQWACVLAFYCVVHYIEEAASTSGLLPATRLPRNSHAWDDWWVREHAGDLHPDYLALYDESIRSRYRRGDPEHRDVVAHLARAENFLDLVTRGRLPASAR